MRCSSKLHTGSSRENDRPPTGTGGLLACLFFVGIVTLFPAVGCKKQRAVDRYDHSVELRNADPFHVVFECIRDTQSGGAYAVATIVSKDEVAKSCLEYSFVAEAFVMDGKEVVDLSGPSWILVKMPGGQAKKLELRTADQFDEASKKLDIILADLKAEAGQ